MSPATSSWSQRAQWTGHTTKGEHWKTGTYYKGREGREGAVKLGSAYDVPRNQLLQLRAQRRDIITNTKGVRVRLGSGKDEATHAALRGTGLAIDDGPRHKLLQSKRPAAGHTTKGGPGGQGRQGEARIRLGSGYPCRALRGTGLDVMMSPATSSCS